MKGIELINEILDSIVKFESFSPPPQRPLYRTIVDLTVEKITYDRLLESFKAVGTGDVKDGMVCILYGGFTIKIRETAE